MCNLMQSVLFSTSSYIVHHDRNCIGLEIGMGGDWLWLAKSDTQTLVNINLLNSNKENILNVVLYLCKTKYW